MTGTSTAWQEEAYRGAFEDELRGLEARRRRGCSLEELEGTLKALYDMDGADWLGRGAAQDAALAAAIAAHESVIAAWRAESGAQ